MDVQSVKNLILTGNPGVGKTTLIKECVLPFRNEVGGFYTEEIQGTEKRLGFLLKTFSGQEAVLAKKGMKSPAKLNKYGINLDTIDKIGVPALQNAMINNKVVVLDEIGTMEMMSSLFCQTVAEVLAGPKPLLASIRLKAEPFTSQIKKMSHTQLLRLDRSRTAEAKMEIRRWLEYKVR